MNWGAVGVIFAVGAQIIGFIWFFSRLNSKFESHLEDDGDRHDVLEKKNENSDKRFYEAFERIGKLENNHFAQLEINRNLADNWRRIEEKLTAIEGLLRNRRSTDL